MAVFAQRLRRQRKQFAEVEILGKMNGAVGNWNAHYADYPDVDWPRVTQAFIAALGIAQSPATTQIEPHDYTAAYFTALERFNTIRIGFCRAIWRYIPGGYFKQRPVAVQGGI